MKSLTRYAVQCGLYLTLTLLLLNTTVGAQGGGKFYVNPDLFLGITSGYDHAKGLDFGNIDRAVHLEARGGYWLTKHASLFSGVGYSSYRYHQVTEAVISGPDTIRTQSQEYWEVPLGVRFSTYYGDRSIRTRYYASTGIRACFLSDARHDYRTPTGSAAEANVVRPDDFNKFWLRFFVEGGIDIPMDYGSGILIGLSVSNGLTRNANTEGALVKENYGVLAIGGNIGVRIGLSPEKPAKRRHPQRAPYRSARGR